MFLGLSLKITRGGLTAGSTPVLQFSASSIPEDTTLGSTVAVLSVANLGALTVSSYAITADPDAKFDISGSNLIIDAAVDYETDTTHSVTVEATLSDASTVEGTQVFTITDVAELPPENTALPSISGAPEVTGLLTADEGVWLYEPSGYTYQWLRDDVEIVGATASTYSLVEDDIDTEITVTVTATNAFGSTPATSAAVGPIDGVIPENTVAPTITGGSNPPEVGETLTANVGTWTGTPSPTFTYQWRAGAAGATNIPGATNSTYQLTLAEDGDLITVVVTGTNLEGSDVGTSAATAAVVTPADVTAPVLSNFVATPDTATTATLSVDTDEGNGTIYWVVVPTASTAPSAAQVEAGTDGSDVAATWSDSAAVVTIDTYTDGPTGLTAGTTYDAYAVHKDAVGNYSNVVTDEFTTANASIAFLQSLFTGSIGGGLYVPSPSTCWQDAAGTTPAAVNDPVGRLDDISGNGRHRTQATAGARPILRQAGSLYYLEYDGTDDVLLSAASFTLTIPNYIGYSGQRTPQDFTTLYTCQSSTGNRHDLVNNSSNQRISGQVRVGFGTAYSAGGANNSFPVSTNAVVDSLLISNAIDEGVNGAIVTPVATPYASASIASCQVGRFSILASREYASIVISANVTADRAAIVTALGDLAGLTV